MLKKQKTIVLYAVLGAFITIVLVNAPSIATSATTWNYSEFLEQVESGQVEKVTINANFNQAVAITTDGQTAAVNLPTDPNLIDVLQQNNVDVSVLPQRDSRLPLAIPMLALAAIALFSFIFWVWMLVDCAINEVGTSETKLVWVLIILFTNLLGALLYFFIRRPQRLKESGR